MIPKINAIAKSHKAQYFVYLAILMMTNVVLMFTEPMGIMARMAFILLPLGIQAALLASVKRPGLMFLLLLPKSILDAFQFVLIALYGGSIIAVDMFLNVVTTNSTEAGELLSNLAPAILLLMAIYIPAIFTAIVSLRKNCFDYTAQTRRGYLKAATATTIAGFIFFAGAHFEKRGFEAKYDIYPTNVFYNMDFAVRKLEKIYNCKSASKGFEFNATLEPGRDDTGGREIYVLIIGETARAHNWSLYGYEKKTTPHADTMSNLIKFNALTQSNTTHKSVPMLLTPADAENYELIYRCKSIITLFKECGFKSIYLTNHNYNGTFMENYFNEADISISLRESGWGNNHDYPMADTLETMLKREKGNKLFVVMHLYGSHFKYSERYSPEFARWQPDHAEVISPKFKQELANGYNNSILSTDYLLDRIISTIRNEQCQSFVVYASDHGEDLMDDRRKRFLHASPLPTAHQLYIPFIFWYSDKYKECHESKINLTLQNSAYTVSSSRNLFHTVADLASIKSPYVNGEKAISSDEFKASPLLYLTDHDGCIELNRLPLKRLDVEFLKEHNLQGSD